MLSNHNDGDSPSELDEELGYEVLGDDGEFEDSNEVNDYANLMTSAWYLYMLQYIWNTISCNLAILPATLPDLSSSEKDKDYGTFATEDDNKEATPPTYWAINNAASLRHVLSESLLWSTSFITTIPHALFALSFPDTPKTFLRRWETLSSEMKIFCVGSALVSLTTGTLIKRQYLPAIFSQTALLFRQYLNDLPNFIKSNAVLLSALVAAIPAGALGFQGFQAFTMNSDPSFPEGDFSMNSRFVAEDDSMSLDKLMFSTSGFILNFLIIDGFRILFCSRFWDLYVDQAQRFKNTVCQHIGQLKPEYKANYNALLQGLPLNEMTVKNILEQMYDEANEVKRSSLFGSDSIFSTPTLSSRLTDTLHFAHSFAWGALLGGTFFVFFAQEGFTALDLICKVFSDQCNLHELDYTTQLMLAAIVGHATGIFGYMTGIDIPATALATYEHVREHPANLLMLAGVGLLASIDATAFISAGRSVTKRDNLFGLKPDNIGGQVFVPCMGILSTAFSMMAMLRLLMLKEKPLPTDSPTMDDVQKWVAKSPAAITQELKSVGFFGGRARTYPKMLPVSENTTLSTLVSIRH